MADIRRQGESHPLRVLLDTDRPAGEKILWRAFEDSAYSFTGTADRLRISRLSLRRWLKHFELWDEYKARRAKVANDTMEEILDEGRGA